MTEIRKVRAGDPFTRIRARDWNGVADHVNKSGLRTNILGFGGVVATSMRGAATILVRNEGGDPVGRHGVLGYGQPIVAPGDNLAEFLNNPSLEGIEPLGRAGPLPVLIPQEPIGAGRIGLCAVAGWTPAMVKVLDERHRYADTAAGELTLVSAWAGPVRIIHLAADAPESGPDVRPALVSIEPGPTEFEAVISNTPTQSGTDWKWSYPIAERIPKADGTFITSAPGLRTGSAYNLIEGGNVTSTSIAPGVLVSDYPDATLDCLPIAVGTPVVVTEVWPDGWEPGDDPLYRINVPNAPKVDC